MTIDSNRCRLPGIGLGAILACVIAVTPALADTVGTASFFVDIDLSTGFPAPFSGSITFNNATQTVFGTPVNLSLANPVAILAPDITHTPSRILTFQGTNVPNSGTYEYRAENGTFLAVTGTGTVVCDAAGCLMPNRTTFDGPVSTFTGTALNGLPAPCPGSGCLAYTTDGASTCCIGNACSPPVGSAIQHCTGVFAINAFQPTNTPASPNCGVDSCVSISATYFDTTRNALVSGTVDVQYFGGVPSPGDATVTAVSNAPGTIAPGFKFNEGGFETVFFDLSTNTGFTGLRQVCVHYQSTDAKTVDGTGPPAVKVSSLTLLHYNSSTGQWDNPGTTLDTANSRVCVTVDGFSPFAVAVRDVGFIPPDKPTFACEKRTALNLAKYAKAIVKCQTKTVVAAIDSKDFDAPACEAVARTNFDAAATALVGCPICAQANEPTLLDDIKSALDSTSVKTFCGGTVPIEF